jgi:drug/metabolite transporter (DMT)-like permease
MSPPEGSTASAARRAHGATFLLFIVPGLWSTNYLVARLADGVIGPHTLAFGRWALAALILSLWAWPQMPRAAAVWRREWPQAVALGALGMWICGAWVYIAAHTTTATNIALIYAVTPVAIAALSTRMLGERMRASQKLGVTLALVGVLFVIARGDLSGLLQVRFAPGDFWIMAAAVAWTAYSVLLRHWPSALGPLQRLLIIIVGGLLCLLPFTLWEHLASAQPPFGLKAMGLVAVAAVVPGVASYGAHAYLQRELGAARTALMLYLAPVYGAIGAWAVLGERPGWHHAAGAALILPSIWLATRRP